MPPKAVESGHRYQRRRSYDLNSFDAMVTVIVGQQKKHFNMHKSLLCQVTDYSHAALNGGFKGTEEQKTEMLEEDDETFGYFQFWIYSKAIKMTTEKECDIEWKQLVDLFIFGEAQGIPALMNAAIDGVIEQQRFAMDTVGPDLLYL